MHWTAWRGHWPVKATTNNRSELNTTGPDGVPKFELKVKLTATAAILWLRPVGTQDWQRLGEDRNENVQRDNMVFTAPSTDPHRPGRHVLVFNRLGESHARAIYRMMAQKEKDFRVIPEYEELVAGVLVREGSPAPSGPTRELNECRQ
jgi:hypothetical protein